MKHDRTRRVSLKGPDNVDKTNQLRLLTHGARFHLLGSARQHDLDP
jgi:hypothetical protein